MSNPGPVNPDVLCVRGLSKTFGAVQALRDVSVDCRAGEIHALVGENGSGKSTLLGIASGFLAPDEGTVEIGASRLVHHSPAAARRLGLGIAYQDYSHVLDLSVAENIYLAAPADARPAYGHMQSWAEETLAAYKLDVPVTALDRLALARRPAAARGRQGAADPAEGAAPRRADDSARARGGRALPHVSCTSRRGRASASSTSAIAFPRCSRSPIASRCFATASGRGRSRPRRSRRTRSSR